MKRAPRTTSLPLFDMPPPAAPSPPAARPSPPTHGVRERVAPRELWAAVQLPLATPVQEAVLAAGAEERDLLVSAQTGSGKTVAYGLAIAPTLLGEAEKFGRATTPLALVVAPTRELAMQVQRELAWLYEHAGARVIACIGGTDARAESRALAAGAHIVVGTPGRLRDHIERRQLDLSQISIVKAGDFKKAAAK
jgi:ATP-dependent RNA helicase DeaD